MEFEKGLSSESQYPLAADIMTPPMRVKSEVWHSRTYSNHLQRSSRKGAAIRANPVRVGTADDNSEQDSTMGRNPWWKKGRRRRANVTTSRGCCCYRRDASPIKKYALKAGRKTKQTGGHNRQRQREKKTKEVDRVAVSSLCRTAL